MAFDGWLRAAGAALAGLALSTSAWARDLPEIKVAALEGGTVNWELDTIAHYGFDTENGFTLKVVPVAGKSGSDIMLQGGAVDAIVTDWFWVARMRAAGEDFSFIPYSRAVGGLMVRDDSPAQDLSDLRGKKIGIAGGPIDKSWLILRAYAEKTEGFDLAKETEQVFGAPPLIMKAALSGEVDGAINFWHFAAKMDAAGMRPLVSVGEAARALGLSPETPLLGYVLPGDLVETRPELAKGLAAASRAAKDKLASDDDAFARLRPIMRARDDAQYQALVAGWRAGIPASGPVDEEAADRMLRLMAELGGTKLVGGARELPKGTFLSN